MKSNVLRALILVLASLPLLAAADERILDYRSDIRVRPDGQLAITETIRVRAEGHNIRRGIYRDFPTRYRDRWGNHVRVAFSPVSVERDGAAEAWHSEARGNGVRVYFGRADRLLQAGEHEYRFVFVTNRQLGYFDDHDELYFNAIGNGWAFPIDHGEATVTLPFTVPSGQLQADAYTGLYGSRESNARADISSGNRVRFETTRPLQPGEGLTVAVAWPKGLITEPAWQQKIRWFLHDNGAALVLLLGLLLPLAWYLWAWNRVGRDPDRGIIIPRFEPPKGLSPAACRYVGDMSFGKDAFTAAVVSLAVKGWILIEENGSKDFELQRLTEDGHTPLSAGEAALLEALLPRPGDRIDMDNENYRDFQSARKKLGKALKKEYLGRLFKLNGIYLAPPVLMTIAAAIIALAFPGAPVLWIVFITASLLVHLLFAYLLRAPTPAGRQVMDEIEGFRRYLDTAEQDRLDRMRSPELTPEVFESFLPYAFALGVANSWCERFARELPRDAAATTTAYQPGWYHGRYSGIQTLGHFGGNFGSSLSSAISSASTPPGSSSGGGGGGSSGGGGGGGGGGGW